MAIISIIVPVYNTERYLDQCVRSLLCQTYGDLEIILVNDGSTDHSGKLCDAFAEQDSRVIVLHKENGGLSDARNAGLDMASGQYISFIDSDDFVAENMYERMLAAMEAHSADLVVCDLVKVDEQGVVLGAGQPASIGEGCLTPGEVFLRFAQENLWQYIPAWNKLYRSDLFRTLRFPAGKLHEDEFVFHKVLHSCQKIVCISTPFCFYRIRPDSITTQAFSARHMDMGEALLDQYRFAKEHGYSELRSSAARRLACRLEEWLPLVCHDPANLRRYHELRKRSMFLIFEGHVLSDMGLKRKIYFCMELMVPGLGRAIRKLFTA